MKLALAKRLTYQELATSLGLSLSEVHGAVKRATAAGLLGLDRRPHRTAVLEFLLRGVKYVFVPKRGQLTRGMPTAHGAPPLDRLVGTGLGPPPVWPDPQGTVRGESFEPLYSSVPSAARKDPRLYEALCLIDAIRGGRPRDAQIAEKYLRDLFSSEGIPRLKRADSFSLGDSRRDRIGRRLAQIGPGPASFYASAVELLALETPLEATSHLVGHLARDIESALGQVVRSMGQEKGPSAPSDDGKNHERNIRYALQVLGFPIDGPVGRFWISLSGRNNEDGLHKRARRRDLSSPRPIDGEFWDKFEWWIDEVLDGLERSYAIVFDRVDKLAASPPTTDNAKVLRGQIPQNHEVAKEFFRKIDAPAWIGPLAEVGFFQVPPPPEAQDHSVSYPSWPALDYLARMTTRAPEKVADVALAIPPTENFRVHEVLAQIAVALPPSLAAPFADRLDGWLADDTLEMIRYGLLGTVAMLVEQLVAGDELDAACKILETLLRPSSSPESPDPSRLQEVRCRVPREELLPLMDRLSSTIKSLGRRAFELFTRLLAEAVVLYRNADAAYSDAFEDEWDDLSWIWRAAIEDHPRNGESGLLTILVSAVRDSSVCLIKGDPKRLSEVVEALEAHRWSIFHRLSAHLLAELDAAESDTFLPRILDRRTFDARYPSHEHAQLLRKSFRRLDEAQQRKILAWIDETDSDDRKITWLKVIVDDLTEGWRTKLETLGLARNLPAADELPPPLQTSYAGPTSPIEQDSLVQMTPDGVVDFVVSWTPSPSFGAAAPAGLSRVIESVVASRPDSYASAAKLLERLDPTYLRGALDGFADAVRAGRPFDWTAVIELCAFVTSQPRKIAGRKPTVMGLAPNWGGARAAVLRLLSEGLEPASRSPIPIEAKERVWSALRLVFDDPDGGPPRKPLREGVDPVEQLLNSVRGNSVLAAIDYASWAAQREVSRGLPKEVREELERQLAHPSVPILAAFGQRIGQLAALDEAWCHENVSTIFSSDADGRDPAWETYLRYGHLDARIFRVLRRRYAAAVADIGAAEKQLAKRIGVHLAQLYWHRQIDFGDEDGLLDKFFAGAPSSITGHALEHLGRLLHDDTPPTLEALARLRLLWHKRSTVGRREELAAFGWWFSSQRFDEEWALDQLRAVLAAKVLPLASEKVAKRLAALVPSHLPAVLTMLDLLLRANDQGWGLLGWRGPARAILTAGLASANEDDKRRAAQIAHRLCSPAYGYEEFRSLLPRGSASAH